VRSKIMVRPDEITEFYNQNKRKFIKTGRTFFTVIALQDESQREIPELFFYVWGRSWKDLATKYTFTVDKLSSSRGQDLRQ